MRRDSSLKFDEFDQPNYLSSDRVNNFWLRRKFNDVTYYIIKYKYIKYIYYIYSF